MCRRNQYVLSPRWRKSHIHVSHSTNPFTGAAIFNTKISKLLPAKVSHAALSNGLPSASLGRFIGDLTSQNTDDMMKIPGITPKIIQASVAALQDAYLDSFHAVWYAASAFAAVGLIGE